MTITAIWNGVIVAQSDDTLTLEGNHYFPPGAVRDGMLTDSETTSTCPWKGTASYFSIQAGGEINEDAAWTYRNPKTRSRGDQGPDRFLARRRDQRQVRTV